METEFIPNAQVTAEEMQCLLESVGHGAHRSIERNRLALAGSIFVAGARSKGKLVGILRLVGDGGYILHVADLEVHPDFQRKGIGRKLMEMGIDFARNKRIGTGENLGEFTLFADVGADRFYEKLGFTLAPNGMVLVDGETRRKHERDFEERWRKKR
ncbi:MAG: GNAT family N-acetyltransferase [Planctomycetota bacterium]|jgi:GNAT superfamily N-acetyltransferase